MLSKVERMPNEGAAVWIDPQGYGKAVAEHEADYREEFAKQQPPR